MGGGKPVKVVILDQHLANKVLRLFTANRRTSMHEKGGWCAHR